MARRPKKVAGPTQAQAIDVASTPVEATPGSSSSDTSTRPSILTRLRNRNVQTAVQLVVLAAVCSPLSQLTLAPVYGSVPAALYHKYGLTASVLLSFALRGYLPKWIGQIVPAYAFWIPTLQWVLFKASSTFGNPFGPLITEMVTYYPLMVLSFYVAGDHFDTIDLGITNSGIAQAAPSMGFYILFTWIQRGARGWLPSYIGSSVLTTRIGLQLVVAMLYGVTLPSSVFWPALPSVLFTMSGNVHTPLMRTTNVLNNTLALYDYNLLERHESLTGYLSVLEDKRKEFRVLRCDHSLLGGEWTVPPAKGRIRRVQEPIYAIFTMLEAVRLVEIEGQTKKANEPEKALNIGVGIGTAPTAMIAHGVNTTIIEIDPWVHYFAGKYFGLPHNHSFVIGDAVEVVGSWQQAKAETYDYIIHDVFTGGVEPVELFTSEFLSGLHTLLKPDGVVAINYAGDVSMPAASLIYRTINAVFETCRVFREDEAPLPGTKPDDFTNMVFFCIKKTTPIRFRKPKEADYLGSGARRQYLVPKHEMLHKNFRTEGDILKRGKTRELQKWQAKSSIGHWEVMRTVLPDAIWENW